MRGGDGRCLRLHPQLLHAVISLSGSECGADGECANAARLVDRIANFYSSVLK
jgi:hypothetical protein